MTRQTSIDAYHEIKLKGLLSVRRFQIYDVLHRFGALTANEVFEILKKETDPSGKQFRFDSNTRARFTELRELGVVKELGTQKCSVTGRECILWDVTGNLPAETPSRITNQQKVAYLRACLHEALESLTANGLNETAESIQRKLSALEGV